MLASHIRTLLLPVPDLTSRTPGLASGIGAQSEETTRAFGVVVEFDQAVAIIDVKIVNWKSVVAPRKPEISVPVFLDILLRFDRDDMDSFLGEIGEAKGKLVGRINLFTSPLTPFTVVNGSPLTFVTSRAASGEMMVVQAPVLRMKSSGLRSVELRADDQIMTRAVDPRVVAHLRCDVAIPGTRAAGFCAATPLGAAAVVAAVASCAGCTVWPTSLSSSSSVFNLLEAAGSSPGRGGRGPAAACVQGSRA